MDKETIAQKTYRIMIDLHRGTGLFPTLEESLKDSIFLTVRDALEIALAEEREACAKTCEELDTYEPEIRQKCAEAIRARGN